MQRIKKNNKGSDGVREHFSPITIIMLIVLALYALSMIVLLGWALLTAFKEQSDFRVNIIGFPTKWVWNFSYVYKNFKVAVQTDTGQVMIGMGRMYVNSILYALGCAFFNTLVPCITAYMCAKFPYKFSKVVHTTVIVTMIIPIVGALPMEITVARFLHLYIHIFIRYSPSYSVTVTVRYAVVMLPVSSTATIRNRYCPAYAQRIELDAPESIIKSPLGFRTNLDIRIFSAFDRLSVAVIVGRHSTSPTLAVVLKPSPM